MNYLNKQGEEAGTNFQADSPGDFHIVVLQKPIYDKYLLLPVKNYWTWTNTYPKENIFFLIKSLHNWSKLLYYW